MVFETAWTALKPGGRMVVNAVTLETEMRLAELFARHGGALRRIAIARAEPLGGLHGWRDGAADHAMGGDKAVRRTAT